MPFDCLPESIVSDLVKLRMARDGFRGKNGWTTHELGLPNDAAHCVLGWVLQAAEWDHREATRLVTKYVYPALPETAKGGRSRIQAVYLFNDNRPRAAVAKLFDDAVRLAETV